MNYGTVLFSAWTVYAATASSAVLLLPEGPNLVARDNCSVLLSLDFGGPPTESCAGAASLGACVSSAGLVETEFKRGAARMGFAPFFLWLNTGSSLLSCAVHFLLVCGCIVLFSLFLKEGGRKGGRVYIYLILLKKNEKQNYWKTACPKRELPFFFFFFCTRLLLCDVFLKLQLPFNFSGCRCDRPPYLFPCLLTFILFFSVLFRCSVMYFLSFSCVLIFHGADMTNQPISFLACLVLGIEAHM